VEERVLRELCEAVVQDPADADTWAALGRRLARGGVDPQDLGELPLEALEPAWAEVPHERGLLGILLAARGWSLPSKKRNPPGIWWRRHRRLGEAPDHHYDAGTGMPLFVRHDLSGRVLAWLPPGEVRLGEKGEHRVELAEGRWIATEPLRPTEVQAMRAALEKPAVVPEGHGTSWAEATRLLERLTHQSSGTGGLVYRLPGEAEWYYASGPDPVDEPGDAGRNRWGLVRSGTLSEWTEDSWTPTAQDRRADGVPAKVKRTFPRTVCGGDRVRQWSRLRREQGPRTRRPDLAFRYILGPAPRKAR
jgi:hypothetical protein